MMGSTAPTHVLLVSFPAQGHVNPLLRLGNRLAAKGLLVTFSTTELIGKDMRKANNNISDQATPVGEGFIRFEFFQDGWEEDDPRRKDLQVYLPQLELAGKDALRQLIKKHADKDHPVSCLINNSFIPWVCDVATDLGIPNAVLWVQSCASFSTYYHYHHNLVPFPSESEPKIDVQLPCMPLLKYDEVPEFLHPSSPLKFFGSLILGQFKNLFKPFCILMDTFQQLEPETIDYMSRFCMIKPVGPLFINPNTSIRGDFLKPDEDCIEWLNSKPQASVVYISFGSLAHIGQEQADELAYGLLNSGISFLWVMKPPQKDSIFEMNVFPDGFLERVGNRGKVIQWSPQEEVLAHPSVACFVTHCGWNSSVEALTLGMPVVTFPQWGDQVINAKFLVDVFGVGVRLSRGWGENRLISRDEVEKCLLEATVGPKAVEMKQNALKWKAAAADAVAEGGSSDKNIQSFVDEIRMRSCGAVNSTSTTQ
jgi:hypothetical protein